MAKAKKDEVVVDEVAVGTEPEVVVAPVVVEDEILDEDIPAVQTTEELQEELNAATLHCSEFEKTCMSAAYLNKLSPKKRAQTQRRYGELKLAVSYLKEGIADSL